MAIDAQNPGGVAPTPSSGKVRERDGDDGDLIAI